MTNDESLVELTAAGEGFISPLDPRMNREPAGSLLLGRAGAIRNAQHVALRQVIKNAIPELAPALEELVDRELMPRSSEFVHDRHVLAESRTEPSAQGATYRVELRVVFDMRTLTPELERLRR